ncbi:MAG: DUF1854 domain-containing protein [Desulfurococcaceae archaeon]
MSGTNCQIIETDLDRDLRFSPEIVEICGDTVRVFRNGVEISHYNDVRNFSIECNVSVCRLIAHLSNGDRVNVVFFTKRKEDDFRKFIYRHYNVNPPVPITRRTFQMSATLRWLFGLALQYKKLLVIGIVLSITLSLISVIPPYLMKLAIDRVLVNPIPSLEVFLRILSLMAMTYMAITLIGILRGVLIGRLGNKISADLSIKLYEQVIAHLEPIYLDNIGIGKITSRIVDDANSLNWLLAWLAPSLASEVLNIAFTIVAIIFVGSHLSVYIFIPIPLIALFAIYYRKKIWPLFNARWRRGSEIYSRIYDTIPNYVVVRSFGKEISEILSFSNYRLRLYLTEVSIITLNSLVWPFLTFMLNLATLAIWWIGGLGVINRVVELGTVSALVTYTSQLYMSVTRLGEMYQQVQRSMVSAERIRELLLIMPKRQHVKPAKSSETTCTEISEIVFDDVHFSYDIGQDILRGVTLSIKKGDKVAIIGKSGVGKSTIIKLMMGFYRPSQGKITFNGIEDLDHYCLVRNIGYVPQEITLFNTTIGLNVGYGLDRYDPFEIIKACKISMIHDEIIKLPLAYDTVIGERGFKLSVGQRQRIAIARAVVKNPNVYIFDEATSNLDVINEKVVFTAILNIARDKTAIFVTHNVFEILLSERVIVIDNGRVVEEGEPLKLIMDRNSRLYNMFREQIVGRNVAEIADIINSIKEEVYSKERVDVSAVFVNNDVRIVDYDVERGVLSIEYNGFVVNNLKPRRLFPITAPNVIGLYTEDGKEVLIIDLDKLNHNVRRIIENISDRYSKVFEITKINKTSIKGEAVIWHVETDCGNTIVEIVYRGGMSQIYEIGDKIVIVDKYSNVFKIDTKRLDQKSLKIVYRAL